MRNLTQYLHLNSAAASVPRDDPPVSPHQQGEIIIQSLYDVTRANFKLFYQHSTEISIDEAMKGYKGCTELRQVHVSKTREVWHQILGKV